MADAKLYSTEPDSANGNSPSTSGGQDWPTRASATVVQYVGTVRDKTTGPALKASRNLVYLLLIGLIGLVVLLLLLLLMVRLMVVATSYVPGVELGEPWLAYFILGGIFLVTGAVLWWKKER